MADPSTAPGYWLDNAWQGERQRLAALEARYDPGTIRHLDAIGVGDGWRCWEVGAGDGSITAWLCRQVGPTGQVLATDIDARFVEAVSSPNLMVRTHNLVTDPTPGGPFDRVHTRLLLTHLSEREALVHRLAAVLAPGGWLVLEEFDTITSSVPDPRLDPKQATIYLKVRDAFLAQLSERRGALGNECGRWLCGWMLDAGLIDVGGEGRVFMNPGSSGEGESPFIHPRIRASVLATGMVTEEEVEAFIALRRNPTTTSMSNILMAAWGRQVPVDAKE